MEASHIADRSGTLSDGRPTSYQRSRRRFVIDDLFNICSRTIFSPTFALLIPATTAIYLNRTSTTDTLKNHTHGGFVVSGDGLETIRRLALNSKALRLSIWYAGAVCLSSERPLPSGYGHKGIKTVASQLYCPS